MCVNRSIRLRRSVIRLHQIIRAGCQGRCVVVPVDGPMECYAECGDPGPASGPRSACWLAASRVMPVLGRCVASRGPPGPDAAVI